MAVAFLGKRATPSVGLAPLTLAVNFLDVLWPIFLLLGVEHARIVPGFLPASPLDLYDYPYSHSLLFSVLWSVLFSLPWSLRRRWKEAAVVAGCVFSHFVLDVVSHRADVPLTPWDSTRLGLGLWKSVPATLGVEGVFFGLSLWVYVRGTVAKSRAGTVGLALYALVLTAVWVSAMVGPPPPGIFVVAWSAIPAMVIFLLWARSIDRARVPRES